MVDREYCKTQLDICSKMWNKDIERIEDRFIATEKALFVHQKELERRMHEANDLKKEFTGQVIELQIKVGSLETRSALWLKVIGFGLAILQIIIAFIIKSYIQ